MLLLCLLCLVSVTEQSWAPEKIDFDICEGDCKDEGIVIPPKDRTAAVGNSVSFTCTAGNPSSNAVTGVQWYKVSSSGTDTLQTNVVNKDLGNTQYESKLILTNLLLANKGSFYCKATYTDASVVESARVTLFVIGFEVSPESQNPRVGDSATFTCVSSGGSATISWILEDNPIPSASLTQASVAEHDYDDTTQTQKSVLTLSYVSSTYEGVYRCVADYGNSLTADSSRASLVIYNVEVGAGFGILGSSVTLTCTIISDREPERVDWTKDKNVIADVSSTSEYSAASKTTVNRITLSSLKANDFGEYSCIAYYDSLTTFLHADGASLTQLEVVSVSTSAVFTVGDTTTLTCSVNQPAGLSGLATLAWSKGGLSVSGSALTTSGTVRTLPLALSSMSLSHTGDYKCTVSYPDVDGTLETEPINVFVRGWVTPLGDNYLLAGTSGKLTCVAQTEAEPVISWVVDGSTRTGAVNTYENNQMTSVFETGLQSSDRTVVCRATVSGVTIETTGAIKLLDMKSYSADDVTVVSGSTQSFTCVSHDRQTPSIVWYKDGVALPSDQDTEASNGVDMTSTLTLNNVGVSDRGSYSCLLRYSAAGSFAGGVLKTNSFSVSVTAEWNSPADISVLVSSEARLTCSFLSSAKATSITWKVGSGQVWSDVALDAGTTATTSYSMITTVTTNVLSFASLTSGSYGQYKCAAVYGSDTIESSIATISETTFGFTKVSDTQAAQTGTSVALTCDGVFSSASDVTVTWLKNGQDLSVLSTTSDVTSTTTKYSISITAAVADSGSYQCQMSSTSAGKTVQSLVMPLFVRGFSEHPAYSLVKSGSEITLTCVLKGDAPNFLVWLKDGSTVSTLSLTKSITNTVVDDTTTRSELYVFNVAGSDVGQYRCKATWSADSTELMSTEALLLPADVAVTEQYGVVGSSTTLVCVGIVPGGYKPTLSLYKGPARTTPLVSTGDPTLLAGTTDNYSLKHVIGAVIQSDFSDEYNCVLAYNALSLDSENSALKEIVMISTSAAQSVAYGDSVTLTCTATLVSGTTVSTTWLKDGQSITSTNEGAAGSVYRASLEFDAVSDTDAGTYRCSMSYDSIGSLTSQDITLGIDSFKTHPADLVMFAGNELSLRCLIKANVAIKWKMDGNLLSESAYTSVQGASQSSSILTYGKAAAANSGDYVCEAEVNGKTINTDTGTVKVYEFSTSPVFKKVVISTAATLSCAVKLDPTSPTVSWEKDGAPYTKTSLVTDTSDSTHKSSKLVLSSTSADDLGVYRCKAVFPAGAGFAGGTLYSDEAALMVLYIGMEAAASASEGESLTLTATLVNDAEVTIQWSKQGGSSITSGNGVTISQTFPNSYTIGHFQYIKSTLTFASFSDTDAGVYLASATATFNGNNLAVDNTVGTKVDLSNIFLTNGFANTGEDVTMYCMYEGSATVASFTYHKQDTNGNWVEVDASPSRVTVTTLTSDALTAAKTLTEKSGATSGSTLVITAVAISDVGLYKCAVKDTSDITTESLSSTLQLLTQSIVSPKMVETGETARITCTFTGPTVPQIKGQTFVSDFADDIDALLVAVDSTTSTENGITTITTEAVFSKVIRKNGLFKCHATFQDDSNSNLKTELLSDHVEILSASIELGTHESSLPVYEGVTFTFICQYSYETAGVVSISPTPGHTTSKEIEKDGITTGYKNGQFGKITSTSFTGPYVCSIVIEGNTLSKQINLEVLSIPAVPSLGELTVQDKDYGWLTCTVTSDLPLFSVSWFTNGDGTEEYVTTHRSKDGTKQTGVSERVYGLEYYRNREFFCKQTISSSFYASEVSFVVKRVMVKVGDARQFGRVSSDPLYVGDSLTVTCQTEPGSTARLFRGWSDQTLASTSSTDNGAVTLKYEVDSSVTVSEKGDYWCEIKKDNRWNVYLGPLRIDVNKRCENLVNPDSNKATLTYSASGAVEIGTEASYICSGDNRMSSRWGKKITTTCTTSGYWSHTRLTTLRLELPPCSARLTPTSFKATMVVTFGGLTCPPDSSDEIFEFIKEQKFRDLDMRGFKSTLVATKNYFTTDKCKVTWVIESDGSWVTRTPEDLLAVKAAQMTALYSSKRFSVEDDEADKEASDFDIECPSGAGISSDNLYCVQCGVGTYSTSQHCVSCPIGTYQEQAGETSCQSCPQGQSTLSPGSTSCLDTCEVGTVMFGTTDPPSGYSVEAGTNIVTTCDQGYFVGTQPSVSHICGVTEYCSRVVMQSGYEGYANNGNIYTVTCQYTTADPSATLTWYDGISALDCAAQGSGCTVTDVTDSKTTTSVLEVTLDGSAGYSCKLGTTPADHTHEVTVLVNDITVDSVLLVGDTYTFTCTGEQPEGVDLPPTILAFINKKEVHDGSLSSDGLTLEVEFKATSDITLTCEYLYIQVEQDVVVTADAFDIIGILEAPNRDVFLPVGDSYDIKCSMHNVDSIEIHKVDSNDADTSVGVETSAGSSTYTLTSINPVIAQYYCLGTKNGQNAETTKHTFTILASTNIISGPSDQYTIGESVSFACEVPTGTTVSFKSADNAFFDTASATSQKTAANGNAVFTLTISEPIIMDEGEYYCEGTGGRSAGARLNFVRILTSPTDLYRDEGQSATFVCSVTGIVDIKWSTPTGYIAPDYTFVTEDDVTIAELHITATEGGLYYCVAQDIVSSKSARLVVMKVELTVPETSQGDDEITVTCVVYGDHDGISIFNEGRMLTVETPLDAMTTMASGGGTAYESTYDTSLSKFTNGVTKFTCTAYYDNFQDLHSEEESVYFIGFYKQPTDIRQLPGTFDLVAHVSAAPSQNIVVSVYQVTEDGDEKKEDENLTGGVKSVGFQLTIEVASTGVYYYKLVVSGVTAVNSDNFKITSYGSPVQSAYEIKYPGSSIDSLTLTCVLKMPYESPVTWTNGNGDAQGSDNPLITTTYSETDQILTSTFTISSDGSQYSCSAIILETKVTIEYDVILQNFALVPTDKNSMFFDNTAIQLTASPSTFTPEVFAPDGTPVDISQPLNLYAARDFISVISWNWGDHESTDFYQTETIHVAGVYLEEPEVSTLVAGETSTLTCTIASTDDITAVRADWDLTGGSGTNVRESFEKPKGESVVTVAWRNDLQSGDKVIITCTVRFDFKDGSASVSKNHVVEATVDTKCDTTSDIANGVLTADASMISPSETVSVKCNDGYQLSGKSEYRCQGGKLWTTPPRCVKKAPLCPAVAPQGALITYFHPYLTMACTGTHFPFQDPPALECSDTNGWDLLSETNPVSKFEFCGKKVTPYSKSVTAAVSYKAASNTVTSVCANNAADQNAYSKFTKEVDLKLEGISASLVDCRDTPTGYTITVKYTIDYIHLSQHNYLDLEDLAMQIESSDGDPSTKRAATWKFDSTTFTYDLNCPLSSPSYLYQCVECPPGFFSTGTACVACPKGQYQHEAGKTFCLICPVGKTTPGTGASTIDECGATCSVPEVTHGVSYPAGGSSITASLGVTLLCSLGYSPQYGYPSTFSCAEVAAQVAVYGAAAAAGYCQEICIVPDTAVSEEYFDIIAGTEVISGETKNVKCVEGYSIKSDVAPSLDFISLQCVNGELVKSSNGYCKKDGLSVGLIILIILLVIAILLILCLIPLCCYWMNKNKEEEEEDDEKDLEMRPQSAFSCSNHVVVRGKADAEASQIGNSNPFKVSGFNDHIRSMATNKNEGFIREFRSICVGSDTKKIVSQLSENYNKNRYGTITTYDHSRVRLLMINNDHHSDYINASYINGYVTPNAYIATQGPLESTVNDYWRMIWEQNVNSVVMLTNLEQGGQKKCVKYWPNDGAAEQFGVVNVKKLSENKFPGFLIREFELGVEGAKRPVLQFHYTEWPEVGYPVESKFITFIYYIRYMRQDSKKPLVVHCSAGAGWTGVFIGMDSTLDRLTKEDTVDVLGCVNSMRQQRSAMVQNEPQYIYLHKILLDSVNSSNFNRLRANRFRSNLEGAIFINPSASGLNEYEAGI